VIFFDTSTLCQDQSEPQTNNKVLGLKRSDLVSVLCFVVIVMSSQCPETHEVDV